MYKVQYLNEARQDILNLPKQILREVKQYLLKYEQNPFKYSQSLEDKHGLNLAAYRKTYIANATYRIIIKIENDVLKIVEVVAVGERKDLEVYKMAHERINK